MSNAIYGQCYYMVLSDNDLIRDQCTLNEVKSLPSTLYVYIFPTMISSLILSIRSVCTLPSFYYRLRPKSYRDAREYMLFRV